MKIIAYNGTEVIDNTPFAELRLAAMDYLENRQKRKINKKHRMKNSNIKRR